MAERKSSSTLHSKGSTGEFAKQVQRKFSRAQEKVRFILTQLVLLLTNIKISSNYFKCLYGYAFVIYNKKSLRALIFPIKKGKGNMKIHRLNAI